MRGVRRSSTRYHSAPARAPVGVGAFADATRSAGAQRTDPPPARHQSPAGRALGRSLRETPTSPSSRCSRRNRFAICCGESRRPRSISRVLPLDRQSTWLGPARTMSSRPPHGHCPIAAPTSIPSDLAWHRRHRTADPRAIPPRLHPKAILSAIFYASDSRRASRHRRLRDRGPSTCIQPPSVANTG